MDWSVVRKEMVDEKGILPEVADQIGQYVTLHGGSELVEKLKADPKLAGIQEAQDGIEEMGLMLRYCELFGVIDKASLWCSYIHDSQNGLCYPTLSP